MLANLSAEQIVYEFQKLPPCSRESNDYYEIVIYPDCGNYDYSVIHKITFKKIAFSGGIYKWVLV